MTPNDKISTGILDIGILKNTDITCIINTENILPLLMENIDNVVLNEYNNIITPEIGALHSKSIDRILHMVVEDRLELNGLNIINKYDSSLIGNREYINFLHTNLHKVKKLCNFYFDKYYWEILIELTNLCLTNYNVMLDTILESRSGILKIIIRRV